VFDSRRRPFEAPVSGRSSDAVRRAKRHYLSGVLILVPATVPHCRTGCRRPWRVPGPQGEGESPGQEVALPPALSAICSLLTAAARDVSCHTRSSLPSSSSQCTSVALCMFRMEPLPTTCLFSFARVLKSGVRNGVPRVAAEAIRAASVSLCLCSIAKDCLAACPLLCLLVLSSIRVWPTPVCFHSTHPAGYQCPPQNHPHPAPTPRSKPSFLRGLRAGLHAAQAGRVWPLRIPRLGSYKAPKNFGHLNRPICHRKQVDFALPVHPSPCPAHSPLLQAPLPPSLPTTLRQRPLLLLHQQSLLPKRRVRHCQ
jgi:hypothetical protein